MLDLAADPVERARALAAQGRYLAAVEAGEAAGGDGLAREMAAWRYLAFRELAPGSGRPDWPPSGTDPAPDRPYEIPEIAAGALSGEVLSGALLGHGSLIVRGLIDAGEAAGLCMAIDRALAGRGAARAGGEGGPDYAEASEIRDELLGQARAWAHDGAILMVDAPRFLARWVRFLKESGVHAAVSGHLGETAVLSAKKATLYRVPPGWPGQWHQDGAFLGADARTVNLWVALSDCGIDAPGLDIVPWRLNEIVPGGTHGSPFDWAVGEGKVREIAGDRPLATPVFRAGDAILFDHLCLHTTGGAPGMTRPRYAVESWMFAPSAYPYGEPLVI